MSKTSPLQFPNQEPVPAFPVGEAASVLSVQAVAGAASLGASFAEQSFREDAAELQQAMYSTTVGMTPPTAPDGGLTNDLNLAVALESASHFTKFAFLVMAAAMVAPELKMIADSCGGW